MKKLKILIFKMSSIKPLIKKPSIEILESLKSE
jgi:hypothetical protein